MVLKTESRPIEYQASLTRRSGLTGILLVTRPKSEAMRVTGITGIRQLRLPHYLRGIDGFESSHRDCQRLVPVATLESIDVTKHSLPIDEL